MSSAATVEGDERLRLFCGFPLPPAAMDDLAAWQHAHLPTGRIVPPANLHVTLAFLGPRPAADVQPVAEALREAVAGVASPALTVRRYRETRTVGMLVLDDENGRATLVADRLHGRLEELGLYRREQRAWLPHVTVLRFRQPPRLAPGLPGLGTVVPSDAAVFLSRLHPSGARYEVLEYVRLGG